MFLWFFASARAKIWGGMMAGESHCASGKSQESGC